MEQIAMKRLLSTAALAAFLVALLLAAGVRGVGLGIVAVLAAVVGVAVAVVASKPEDDAAPALSRRPEDQPGGDVRELAGRAVAGIVAGAQRSPELVSKAVGRSRELVQKVPVSQTLQELPARAKRQLEAPRRESGSAARAWKLNNLSAAERHRGNLEAAVKACEGALAIFLEAGDRRGEGFTRHNLALALARRGDLERAVQSYELALVAFRAVGDKQHEAQVLANLGAVSRRRGREHEAIAYWEAALEKLPRDSAEYGRIAEQLRLAS
jgi:tetratricopeptide (TPR) repeat protein